jgi:hypothetical protein
VAETNATIENFIGVFRTEKPIGEKHIAHLPDVY